MPASQRRGLVHLQYRCESRNTEADQRSTLLQTKFVNTCEMIEGCGVVRNSGQCPPANGQGFTFANFHGDSQSNYTCATCEATGIQRKQAWDGFVLVSWLGLGLRGAKELAKIFIAVYCLTKEETPIIFRGVVTKSLLAPALLWRRGIQKYKLEIADNDLNFGSIMLEIL